MTELFWDDLLMKICSDTNVNQSEYLEMATHKFFVRVVNWQKQIDGYNKKVNANK